MVAKPLDYERRNSYLINLLAVDGANDPLKRLQARATVAVDVLDVQVSRPRTSLKRPRAADGGLTLDNNVVCDKISGEIVLRLFNHCLST